MRHVAMLFAAIFLFLSAKAQSSTVKGRLFDDKNSPLSFANVSLMKTGKGTVPLTGSLTDSLGSFTINIPATGTYYLQFTAIGFAKQATDSFTVTGADFSKDFGTVTLKKETKELANIDIATMRPSIVQLADRMVVNIQGTAMAAGNTAFNVLAKSPGIFVDPEGNIQLNGRGGATVMIDGRLTYLSARDLRNLLESTPAENIKSIEIITSPSAKYDAEGTGGIINIVFRKNVMQGINGTVNINYSTNLKQHMAGGGATINHKSGRWNSFLITDINRRASGREATFTRIFRNGNQSTFFDQTADGNWHNWGPPSVRLGSDFTISQNHSIGFIGSYFTNTAHSDFLTETFIGNAPKTPARFIDADNYNSNTLKNFVSNLHYSGTLDTMGTTLSADFDFARIRNNGEGNFYNTYTRLSDGKDSIDNLYTYTPNGYDIYSGKIDFSYAISKTQKIETGGRISRVESDNDFRFYLANNGLVLDRSRTNHFNYRENIYAGYLNWSSSLSKNTSLMVGLRAEQTISKGQSFTTGEITNRKYLDWFPSAFLQHKASENYNITVNYSRRLNRPNYGNLNPFRSYRDPYTWTVGNPYLRPQYTNVFNLTQTFKKLYIVQLFFQHTYDVMVELPILDIVNTATIYTTGNVDDSYSGGMSLVIPVKLAKRWDTRNTGQLSYSKFTAYQNFERIDNKQLFYYLQSAHTVLLPKDYRAEATFLYRGPSVSGLYRQQTMHRIDLAFSKSFANKKFEIAVNANDITKGWRFRWAANYGGNVNEFDQYLRWRTFGVSFRYNFSKGQKTNIKQRTGPEELNRT
ncbi:MAG TPA: TonB-dependent receptor [Flavisolibacter sp.]|nr:TonB-dependent receptor [Flavisolibacter sp.]